MSPRIVLASHNQGKLRELRAILTAAIDGLDPEDVVTAGDLGLTDVVEDGTSFAENALLKARHVAEQSGLIALADDSGLSVEIMNGSPGIFSARWSGTHGSREADLANLDLLLRQLADIKDGDRAAAFVCAVALVVPPELGAGVRSLHDRPGEPFEHVEHGYLQGSILREPRGDGGFGYDPIFLVDGGDRSLAEYGADEKNTFSHRFHAFTQIAPLVAQALDT
ncbi:non-canonical purine NTP pyrophosphatase [Micrococcales bacterium 31B]|nr:non-canonical purine NTP pyrophosphatase [Micrococcales bacterium 31B]